MPPRILYRSQSNNNSSSDILDSRIYKNPRFGLVSSSDNLPNDFIHVLRPYDARRIFPIISIVICTYRRPKSLDDTLISLSHQTYRNFEIILLSEKGDLANIRQKGLKLS